jgi:hypothetical protein
MKMPTEDVEPMVVTGNGDGPPDQVLNPKLPARFTSRGRFYEILAIISAVGILVVYGLDVTEWVLVAAVILLGIAAVRAYKLAIHCAVEATRINGLLEKERAVRESARTSSWEYKITSGRLETLKAEGVPEDVSAALKALVHEKPLPKKQFLDRIANECDLSLERFNEFTDTVLKYTKVDSRADVAPKPNSRAESGK